MARVGLQVRALLISHETAATAGLSINREETSYVVSEVIQTCSTRGSRSWSIGGSSLDTSIGAGAACACSLLLAAMGDAVVGPKPADGTPTGVLPATGGLPLFFFVGEWTSWPGWGGRWGGTWGGWGGT